MTEKINRIEESCQITTGESESIDISNKSNGPKIVNSELLNSNENENKWGNPQKKRRETEYDFLERKNRYKDKSSPPYSVLIKQVVAEQGSYLSHKQGKKFYKPGAIDNLHPMTIGIKLKNNPGIIEIKRKGRNLVEIIMESYQMANKLLTRRSLNYLPHGEPISQTQNS